ncbi:hypothetical protein Tco_0702192 [Tanacetum coccineum]|uniref:Uncharacterized protein n=1 Tax=Tanacetum coccineum TaxID=301880 RepID=A0ABQ4XW54_9ASTR
MHRRLPHLNFGAIIIVAIHANVQRNPQTKSEDTNHEKLYLLHMDLMWPISVASVNGKKYIPDDPSTLKATVRRIRIDKELSLFIRHLRDINVQWHSQKHQLQRSPQQNGVVKDEIVRLIEAASVLSFPIYQQLTRRIIETIHDDSDELTAKASDQLAFQTPHHEMTPVSSIQDSAKPPPSQHHLYHLRYLTWDFMISTNIDESLKSPPYVNYKHQTPRAWYDMLSSFLISNDFSKGSVDPTLFNTVEQANETSTVPIYVDDNILHAMNLVDPNDTPMVEKSKLDKDKEGKAVDPSHYRGMIGTLRKLNSNPLSYSQCGSIAGYVKHASTSWQYTTLVERLVSWSSKRQKSACDSQSKLNIIAVVPGMLSFTPDTLKQLADEVDE